MSISEEEKMVEIPPSESLEDEGIILPTEENNVLQEEPLPLPPDKPWLKEWVTDMRLEWLRQKVCIGLDIPRSVFNTVIQIEEGSKQLRSFLDGSLSSLLFYLDEVVTVIETIVEPLPPPLLPPAPKEEEKPNSEEVEGGEGDASEEASKIKEDVKGKKDKKDDKKKDKKTDKKGKGDKKGDKKGKKGGQKGKEEPLPEPDEEKEAEGGAEGGAEGTEVRSSKGEDASKEEPKNEEPPKPQIVYVEKRDPILCASTGILSEHALCKKMAYFLKMKPIESITEEQLDHDVESGIFPSGPGMSSLEKVCKLSKFIVLVFYQNKLLENKIYLRYFQRKFKKKIFVKIQINGFYK